MRKVEEKSVGEEESPLDEIARRGAQRMIEAALEVEGSSTCRSCMSIATSGVAPRGAAGASRRGRGRPVAELDHPSGEHLAGRVPGVEEALGWMGVTSSSLVTHFDLPAEHWQHLRTTNPIESTFATVKLRQRVTKGAGSRAAGLAMAFKLLLAAERTELADMRSDPTRPGTGRGAARANPPKKTLRPKTPIDRSFYAQPALGSKSTTQSGAF